MLRSPFTLLITVACAGAVLSCNDEPTALVRPAAKPIAFTNAGVLPVPGVLSRHAPDASRLSSEGAAVGTSSRSTPQGLAIGGATHLAAAPAPIRLIWQNVTTGERSFWLMQTASWDGSAAILPQVPPVWSIAGSGDFNSDGAADILWQNTATGERSIWFMNGNSYSGAALLPQVPTVWSIAGVGDFNADGKPDIVWQNSVTGERSIWFMNGAAFASAALLPQVPTVWSIAAVGDFNGDNKPDLVWQNGVTGERSIWFMNGAVLNGASLLPTVPTVWKIAAATDFSGDSKPDLVWQNTTTGERSIWYMNGATFSGAALLPTIPTQWQIAGVMSLGTQPGCTVLGAIQMGVGAVHTLTGGERGSFCVGLESALSEYVLIPFNNTNVAASTIPVQFTATNTAAILPGGLASIQAPPFTASLLKRRAGLETSEWAFRSRERRDLSRVMSSKRTTTRVRPHTAGARYLTGIPSTPVVGTTVQINANLSGNLCSAPKQLRSALVVAVLPHTIVLSDATSPAGGYTSGEMTSFGQAFDTLGYGLDVANFGTPSDADANGRIAILFTPSVNAIPGPPGGRVLGLFTARDLFAVSSCPASNEGEMFYMPVPDPNQTINANYSGKADLAESVLSTLVHEFQHLINAGRRVYVNNAPSFEEVWLNEGLSHIAEELLYYRVSGNAARSNIALPLLQSSQAQLDAVNTYQIMNLNRLLLYMQAPETNSPFSMVDGLQMRGAVWQLLRYAADRRGGVEQTAWSALVNTTLAGQANFNSVFGNIITYARDWAVAQYVDDAGLGAPANLTNPSWNNRSVMPAINGGMFPLLTRPLLGAPVNITLSGGGAGYVRFGVAANAPATVSATSAGLAVPAGVDLMLVRTR